jgi:hypothetical protein
MAGLCARCNRVRDPWSQADDTMMECSKCGIRIHWFCGHGIQDDMEGPFTPCHGEFDARDPASKLPAWRCARCVAGLSEPPPCIACPFVGGVYMVSAERKCARGRERLSGAPQNRTPKGWIHLLCACALIEVHMGIVSCVEEGDSEVQIGAIRSEAWVKRCSICHTTRGACTKCSLNSCNVWYHPMCAYNAGVLAEWRSA